MPSRRGFTFLELMLALALTALLLGAVSMAVDLHLRVLDSRRSFLEESQLARAVLRIIADDIRSVVLPYEQDMSAVESLLADAASSVAGGELGELESGGGDITGGDPGLSDLLVVPEVSGLESDLPADGDVSQDTVDLVSATTLPEQPGIYGNQYELQMDVSRLPRVDQLQAIYRSMESTTLTDLPSDVKTVTYYVISNPMGYASSSRGQVMDLSQETNPSIVGRGLVRRQMDRAVTQWAMTNGNAAGLLNDGEVLAPEIIAIEFAYFDGLEWRTEWDSGAEGGLPLAIQIILSVTSDEAMDRESPTNPAGGIRVTSEGNVRYYHLVVHIPTARPVEETSDTTM
ncbi:MAG: prepilin-type N-terminal cleavage/methylation domain-containing protein [Pirellulaceae bacterium]